jgi:hypothetical protein
MNDVTSVALQAPFVTSFLNHFSGKIFVVDKKKCLTLNTYRTFFAPSVEISGAKYCKNK